MARLKRLSPTCGRMKKHSPVIMASTPKMESTMQMARLLRPNRGLRRHRPASHLVSIGRISRLMI